jgi:hypothetical protein
MIPMEMDVKKGERDKKNTVAHEKIFEYKKII